MHSLPSKLLKKGGDRMNNRLKLTRAERDDIKDTMKKKGYTLCRWADERGFALQSVRNILYRDRGLIVQRGKSGRAIVEALRREFL
jgi:lambda repressor-like predicted transcriptional regulator